MTRSQPSSWAIARLLRAADDADDRGPGGLAELDGGAADAARRGVHEQRLARLEARPAVQSEPARLVADVQGGRLGVVQGVGRGQHGRLVRDDVLGEAAVRQGGGGDAPGARPRVSPQISTPGVNGSGGRTWYWPRQSSASGKLMFAAQHLQQQLPLARRGPVRLLEPHHLARLAVPVHSPCLHSGPPQTVGITTLRRILSGRLPLWEGRPERRTGDAPQRCQVDGSTQARTALATAPPEPCRRQRYRRSLLSGGQLEGDAGRPPKRSARPRVM